MSCQDIQKSLRHQHWSFNGHWSVVIGHLFLVFVLTLSPVLPSLAPIKLFGGIAGSASTIAWTGQGGDALWSNPNNWSGSRIPVESDLVIFEPGNSPTIKIDENAIVGGIEMRSGFSGVIHALPNTHVSIGNDGFRQESGKFLGGDSTMDIKGSLTLLGGEFNAPSKNLTIEDNIFATSNTFRHNAGTVRLDGFEQIISGQITFNNLVKEAGIGQTLEFPSEKTVTIEDTFILQGTKPSPGGEGDENFIKLRSSQPGTPALMDPQGSTTFVHLDIADIININGKSIKCTGNCIDSGNTNGFEYPREKLANAEPTPQPNPTPTPPTPVVEDAPLPKKTFKTSPTTEGATKVPVSELLKEPKETFKANEDVTFDLQNALQNAQPKNSAAFPDATHIKTTNPQPTPTPSRTPNENDQNLEAITSPSPSPSPTPQVAGTINAPNATTSPSPTPTQVISSDVASDSSDMVTGSPSPTPASPVPGPGSPTTSPTPAASPTPTKKPEDVPPSTADNTLSFFQAIKQKITQAFTRPAIAADPGPADITAEIVTPDGEVTSVVPTIKDGKVSIPDSKKNLSPGKYGLQITTDDGAGTKETTTHPFIWGITNNVETVEDMQIDPVLFNLPPDATELPGKRTKKAVTYSVGKGKRMAQSSAGERFEETGDGRFIPLEYFGVVRDEELQFNRLAEDVDIAINLNQPGYSITQGGHTSTTTYLSEIPGTVESPTTVAYELADHVTLRLSVRYNTIVKEIEVREDLPLPDFTFTVSASPNLSTNFKDSTFTFTDRDGTTIFETQSPFLMETDGTLIDRDVTIETQDTENAYTFSYDTTNLPYPYILDPSSGPNSPGTMADDSSVGTRTWNNVNNAKTSDNSRATVTMGSSGLVSHYLKATNFGFSIGSGTIDGIEAFIERRATDNDELGWGTDHRVRIVKSGTIGSTDKADTATKWPQAESTKTYGSSSDLWGETWSASDIDGSTFGFVLSTESFGSLGPGTMHVDHMSITVHYTPPTIDISGTCKDYDQTTNCPDSQTVKVAVNGTAQAETDTTSSGAFTIADVDEPTSGDVITVWLDGVADANEAVAVTQWDGSGDITGLLLYEEHLTIGSADNQTLTNAEIDAYDNSVSSDEDIFFDVDGSGDLTVDSTSQSSQEELYIVASNTFQPGGNVTTHDVEIDGTWDADTHTVFVEGSWDNDATFTADTSNVVLTSTSDETIDSTGASTDSFYDFTINDGLVGYWKMDEGADNTCSGGEDVCDSSGYNNHGTITNGDSDEWSANPTNGINFTNPYAMEFDGSDDYVSVSNVAHGKAWSAWAKHDDSNVGYIFKHSGDWIRNDGNRIRATINDTFWDWGGYSEDNSWHYYTLVADGTTGRLYVDGVERSTESVTASSGTSTLGIGDANGGSSFTWNGQIDDVRIYDRALTATEVSALAVGNQPATENTTASEFTVEDALDINGDLVINSGELDTKDAEDNSINVAGDWQNNGGIFTPNQSTVTLDGSTSSQELQSGGQNFYNLTVSGSGGWDLHDRLEIDNTYTQSAGTLDTSSNNYNIHANDWDQTAGTFTDNSSTLTITASSDQTVNFDDPVYDLQIEDPTEDDLVGYWKFDEGQGTTAYDLSGSSNDGTLTNNPSWSENTDSGFTFDNPYSIDFDGSDDYVDVGDTSQSSIKTISFWINADDITTREVLNFDNTDEVEIDGSNNITAESFPGTTTIYIDGSSASAAISQDTWHHVTITDTTGVNGSNMDIGVTDGTNYFDGTLDDVRIYDTVLSSTEVANLANGKYGIPDTNDGLVGYWKFDETSAGTFIDSSGGANTGTGNGSSGSNDTPQPDASVSSAFDFTNTRSLDFDGTDDYVHVPANADFNMGNGSFSISTWINTTTTGMNDNIILEHGVWNATGVYQLATAGTNTLRLNFTPGWPVVVLDSGSVTYTDGSWHHVAGVFDTDTDTAYIYFDGTLSNSRTETREVGDGGSKPIYIGSRGGTGNYFTGKIDDMRVYNRALSPREVAALAGGGSEQAAVTLNTSLDVDNDLFVQSGVLDVSDSNCSSASCSLNISGDWNNIDLFSSRSGEVILDGTSHTINGTTDFYNLTKNESSNDSTDEVLTFENSLIFTIRNILDFNGRDSDDRINIVSDSGGTSASLNVTGGQQVVHWADVTDSTADTHNIVCQQCVNGGGNDNGDSEPHWIFGTANSRGRIRVIQIN